MNTTAEIGSVVGKLALALSRLLSSSQNLVNKQLTTIALAATATRADTAKMAGPWRRPALQICAGLNKDVIHFPFFWGTRSGNYRLSW